MSKYVLSSVKDPYGNIIAASARHTTGEWFRKSERSMQQYPWKFAFTADTTGEVSLEVHTNASMNNTPSSNLTVLVYRK